MNERWKVYFVQLYKYILVQNFIVSRVVVTISLFLVDYECHKGRTETYVIGNTNLLDTIKDNHLKIRHLHILLVFFIFIVCNNEFVLNFKSHYTF